MSTIKKVISIVLCIAMLAGSFTILGGLATPDASAAEGTSNIDSYDSLATAYDNFIYFGTEFYEIDITENADGSYGEASNHTLTDYYVEAGQILEARLYVKSDMYCGTGAFITLYDNDFFDVSQVTSTAVAAGSYTTGLAGKESNHPLYSVSNKLKYTLASQNCYSSSWMKSRTGFSQAELESWDYVQVTTETVDDTVNKAHLYMSDEWVHSWYVKVRDDVADNATGSAFTSPKFWKCGDYPNEAKTSTLNGRGGNFTTLLNPNNVTDLAAVEVYIDETQNMYKQHGKYEHVFFEDLNHEFTCGANPADGGSGSDEPVAGTSKIDSYESLATAYDNFIYFGTEFYEIDITVNADGSYGEASNHTLTDYYVEAGQILEARLYVKSDMYCGTGAFITLYDNDFFDVSQVTSTAVAAGSYSTGLAGKESNHPLYSVSNKLKYTLTSQNCYSVSWMKSRTGFSQAELESWDYVQVTTETVDDTVNKAHLYMSDEWVHSWYVKVRDDVADNATGSAFTSPKFWKCGDYPNEAKTSTLNGRGGNFTTLLNPNNVTDLADVEVYIDETQNMYKQYGQYEHVFFEDLNHEFTCGANPNAGTVSKYKITFLENDGTEITESTKDYVAGAAVAVPAAVDGQLGWADASTGKLVDLTDYKATKKATFQRVLDSDEFDVTIALGGGTVDETALPENAKVENGKLIVKANLNEEVDLTKLPAPEKMGYTGTWTPEKVTVDSIKGAAASIVWTANTYTVKFYNAKGDVTPVETVEVKYDSNATTRKITPPAGYKFAGWADAATDEDVSTSQSFKYTYAEDKEFYAKWTKFDSSITIMVRDYEAGNGWKVGAVSYNDAGRTLSNKDVKTLLSDAAATIDATAACMTGTSVYFLYDNAETTGTLVDVSSGIKYNGEIVYYLCTTLDFNVTWKVPVIENGVIVDYTETTGTAKTGATSSIYSTTIKTTADTTPPAGYTFNGWKNEATGETVEYNANLGITLDYSFDRNVVFVADFQETEYTIAFDIQNDAKDGKLTHSETFKIGEEITVDGAEFTNGLGDPSALPTVGLENSKQPKPFMNKNGYKFIGWKLGNDADAVDVTFPIDELTYEMIDKYATGTTITVYAQWEALEYELKFYYAASDADMSLPIADRKYAEPIVVKYKTGEAINTDLDEETLAKINASTPEGYQFLMWSKSTEGVIDKNMPAYGLELYAIYNKQSILVYVDYNNNKTDENGNLLPLKETMAVTPILTNNPVMYGDDVEVVGSVEEGTKSGIGTLIKKAVITAGDMPGENYEVVAWNVYHVEDGADVFDKENWKPGINDEGSSKAYSTLIYQPEWKAHSEFFFRVYNTDGKLYMALGKNFKLYYWSGGFVATRSEAKLNHDPENVIIFFFIPTFENWDWNRFFEIDMWKSVTLRIDPFSAPKSALTIEAFIGLMQGLGNLLGSLL